MELKHSQQIQTTPLNYNFSNILPQHNFLPRLVGVCFSDTSPYICGFNNLWSVHPLKACGSVRQAFPCDSHAKFKKLLKEIKQNTAAAASPIIEDQEEPIALAEEFIVEFVEEIPEPHRGERNKTYEDSGLTDSKEETGIVGNFTPEYS